MADLLAIRENHDIAEVGQGFFMPVFIHGYEPGKTDLGGGRFLFGEETNGFGWKGIACNGCLIGCFAFFVKNGKGLDGALVRIAVAVEGNYLVLRLVEGRFGEQLAFFYANGLYRLFFLGIEPRWHQPAGKKEREE